MDEQSLNAQLKSVKRYQGSYALDELKNVEIKTLPEFIVVNLTTREEGGNHWIAIAIYQTRVYICDSLGGILPDKTFPTELVDFLHVSLYSRTLVMTKQLQPSDSDKCGQYCVVFIKDMSENHSFESFSKLFTNNLQQNDVIVSFLTNKT